MLPSVPELIRAYGRRSSEISQSSAISTESRKRFGAFADQAGTDATSIWAAATSGTGAIAVHLLACLLARMWDSPEATSIWVEIVEARKAEIVADFDQNNIAFLAALSAAKQEITRTQLAEWDASARAWLRVADAVKNKQQKQLMLIIDNLQMHINRKTSTYHSVMDAWKNSMIQMEGLIKGVSQNAQSADILLALSAWHLFPDLSIVAPSMASVRQHDAIFNSGGVLTIGLDRPALSQQAPNGISWSLPLACLRFYGTPVVRSIESSSRSRLSLTELLQVTLGCVLHSWGLFGSDTLRSAKLLANLSLMISEEADAGSKDAQLLSRAELQTSWLSLLFEAAKYYISVTGIDREIADKLISLGRHRCQKFLGRSVKPMFGFLKNGNFVSLLANDHERIDCLRRIARPIADYYRLGSDEIIIRYRPRSSGVRPPYYRYASALPGISRCRKRKPDSQPSNETTHRRRLYAGSGLWRGDDQATRQVTSAGVEMSGESCGFSPDERKSINDEYLLRSQSHDHVVRSDFVPVKIDEKVKCEENENTVEHVSDGSGIHWDRDQSIFGSKNQEFVFGDGPECALFAIRDALDTAKPPLSEIYPDPAFPQELYLLSESGLLNRAKVVERLMKYLQPTISETDNFLQSLKAFSTTASLYKGFQGASVDVRILTRPLRSPPWMGNMSHSSAVLDFPLGVMPYILNRAEAFACITMFESGIYDPEPRTLENVMAISSGNSLYVSAALLVDPGEDIHSGDIRHVPGNVGRPGITFLVPPKDPMIKEVSLSEWPFIDRNIFDGQLYDCFKSTSLHLSFTGADAPFNLGFSGGQDSEAWIVETLVSIHDGRRWIADLDVLKTIKSHHLSKIRRCDHDNTTRAETKIQTTCIDSWHALIDKPDDQTYSSGPQLSLVRAHKNWQARLAAASVSVALGYETIIVPSKVCWNCFNDAILAAANMYQKLMAIS